MTAYRVELLIRSRTPRRLADQYPRNFGQLPSRHEGFGGEDIATSAGDLFICGGRVEDQVAFLAMPSLDLGVQEYRHQGPTISTSQVLGQLQLSDRESALTKAINENCDAVQGSVGQPHCEFGHDPIT